MNTASVLEQVLSSILVAILLGVWEVLRRQYQKRKERANQPPAIAPAPAVAPQPAPPIAPADASVQPAASAAVPPAAAVPTAATAASPTTTANPVAATAAPLTSGDFVTGCLTGVWIFIRIVLSPLLGFVFAAVTSGMLVAFDSPYSTEMGSTPMIVLVLVFTIVNWAVLTFFGMLARMIFQTLTRPTSPA